MLLPAFGRVMLFSSALIGEIPDEMLARTEMLLLVGHCTRFRQVTATVGAANHLLAACSLFCVRCRWLVSEQFQPGVDEIEQQSDRDNENENAHGWIGTLPAFY